MIHLILMAAVKKKIARHRLVLQNVVLDGGRGDRIKKKDFSVFVRKSDFRSHFERPGLTSVGRFQILSLPPILSSSVFMKADIICTNE